MVFFSRAFVLLWQGQLVSQLGNQAFLIATTYFVLEETGSTSLVAAVMMASTVPLAVLGPFGGAVADRHSRRAILIATDLLRALAIGGLGVLLLWRPDVTTAHVACLIAVAAFSGTMAALFMPAVHAIIPDLVPNERLASANSVSQLSNQTAILVGQAAGGVLYLALGAAGLLLLDALSFVYAALATWFIPADRKPQSPRVGFWPAIRQYVAETQSGVAYVRRRRGMTAVLVVFAGVNFLFMPVFVLLPLYVASVLGRGPDWYGYLLAGAGAGALGGAALAGVLLAKARPGARLLGGCVSGIACCVLALAATSTAWVAVAVCVAIGLLSSIVNVTVVTAFQSAVPAEMRGRVMALVVAVSTAAVPIGLGAGGIMGDLWRDSIALVFVGCAGALAALIAVAARLPGFGDVLNPRDAGPQTAEVRREWTQRSP